MSSNNDIDNKNKGGRPTTDVAAERSWRQIPNKMKVKVPTLVQLALDRIEGILTNPKASDSSVLRAADSTLKLYKEMKDAENADSVENKALSENAEGLGALVDALPSISLEAYQPVKKEMQ